LAESAWRETDAVATPSGGLTVGDMPFGDQQIDERFIEDLLCDKSR
jgi:hypothetical protein